MVIASFASNESIIRDVAYSSLSPEKRDTAS